MKTFLDIYLMGVVAVIALQVVNIITWAYVFRKLFSMKWLVQTALWTLVLLVLSWFGAGMIFSSIFRRLKQYQNWHIK